MCSNLIFMLSCPWPPLIRVSHIMHVMDLLVCSGLHAWSWCKRSFFPLCASSEFHESLLFGGPAGILHTESARSWSALVGFSISSLTDWLLLARTGFDLAHAELWNATARARVPLLTSIFSSYCAWAETRSSMMITALFLMNGLIID